LICPWFTATSKNIEQVIHISVDKNETGNERKIVLDTWGKEEWGNPSYGYLITIIQSAE